MIILYSFLVTIVLILTLFYLLYLYYQRSFKYWSNRYVPFLKPSFPFGNYNKNMITESGATLRDIYNELKKTGAQYGGYYMLAMPFFMPLTPELYKEVFIKNFHCFHDRGFFYDEENDPMSAHLVSLTGLKWKYQRSKLNPAFSTIKLKTIFPLMKKCSTDILDIINNSVKIEIHYLSTGYAMDMICSCAFGIDGNNIKNPNTEFREYGRQLLVDISFLDSVRIAFGVIAPHILKKFRICFFNPKFTKFFYQIVQETVKYRERNNVKRNDLIDLLIRLKHNKSIEDGGTNNANKKEEEKEGLTLNQIAAQVFIFFLGGFETSAMALTFCMYELARNSDIQDKVREEILNVLQENGGNITYEVINNLPYTDKVVQEILRKNPPVVMLNRIVTQRYHMPGSGLILDKGTRVVISTLGVDHDPAFYPQPDLFDPERFSDDEKAKRPPMTYFPFGSGPRICIGQKFAMIEIKLALIVFLTNFKYSVHPSTKQNIQTLTNTNLLGLKDKIWLKTTKF